MNFKELYEALEAEIQQSYTEGVTLEKAEKLAAQFLHAQMKVSEELRNTSLDARMRKSGLKAVKAAVYSEACTKSDKKPTETALEHILNTSALVSAEQKGLDRAEVDTAELERLYSIFQNAHIYYRGIAKGKFE